MTNKYTRTGTLDFFCKLADYEDFTYKEPDEKESFKVAYDRTGDLKLSATELNMSESKGMCFRKMYLGGLKKRPKGFLSDHESIKHCELFRESEE